MSDTVRPHRRQPTRLPRPWDSPGKNTGVGCHFLFQCRKVKVKSLSLVWLLATPRTVAHQAPPSMGFSRQECWSGVPSPSPEGCSWKSQFDQMVVISFHSDFEKRKWLKASFCFSLWSVITNWSLKAIGSCWSFQIAEWDKNNSFITQMLTVKNTPMISSDLLWGPFSGQIKDVSHLLKFYYSNQVTQPSQIHVKEKISVCRGRGWRSEHYEQ